MARFDRPDRPERPVRRWLRRALMLLLVATATLALAVTIAYPGFTGSLWSEVRHASFQEMTEDWGFFSAYFVPFVSKLRPDPQTGYWDLQQAALQADRGTDLFERGRIAYHRGNFSEAIAAIEQDIAAHGESERRLFWLAISYQCRAEATNCLERLTDHAATTASEPAHRHRPVCTLPLETTHRQTADTERSAELFERLLDRYAPDDPLYRWLLNFTHMTLGTYQTVRYFRNESGRRFVDATAAFGLLPVVGDEAVIGASFGDADGDGWPDLALSSFTRGRSLILRNVPADNEPAAAGAPEAPEAPEAKRRRFEVWRHLESPDPGFTTSFVDVNQDGRLDLFRGSDGPARSAMRNAVFGEEPDRYANTIYLQGDGPGGAAFERRTDLFGGGMPIGSMGASYGDLDNDGCPDFYLGTGNAVAIVRIEVRWPASGKVVACPGEPGRTLVLGE